MSKFIVGFVAGTALFVVGVTAYAQTAGQPVPTSINYQGRLAKASGTVVEDGTYELTFRLFTTLSGGTKLWEEKFTQVVVRNGVFSVLLGTTSPLDQSLFANQVYIETQVGNSSPLTPRQPIASVPFSLRTEVARTALSVPDGSITSAKLANGAGTEAKIADGAVSGAKLKSSSVTSAKILDGAVASADLANASVTQSKIADSAVGAPQIINGSVNVDKLADGSVNAAKLSNDSTSLEKVTGGRLRMSQGVEAGNNAYGLAHNEQFMHNGFTHSSYGFGFASDNQWTGAPVGYISGWRGLKFFTNGSLHWSLEQGGRVHQYGGQYIDNRGFGGAASIDFALGDTDTGLHWRGDGAYDLMANDTTVAEIRPDRFTVKVLKQGSVQTKNYGIRALYSTEGADVRFTDEGTATLRKGVALVKIDPIFLETTEGEPNIQLTPYGDSLIYVAKISRDRFLIKARKGESDISFAWRASYIRKGYVGIRLQKH